MMLSLLSVLPIVPAHAQAVPTISLSVSSGWGYGLNSVASGTINNPFGGTLEKATKVVITGTNFPAPKEVSSNPQQDDIYIRIADTTVTTTVSPSSGNALWLYLPSREGSGWQNSPVAAAEVPPAPYFVNPQEPPRLGQTVHADANGWFQVSFDVPCMKGDPENVWAVYQLNGVVLTTAAVPFQVVAHIAILRNPVAMTPDGRFGETVSIDAVGYGSVEQIEFVPGNVIVIPSPGYLMTDSYGRASIASNTYPTAAYVGDVTGGNKTIVAYGSGSGESASLSFLVEPSIAVFNTQSPSGTTSSNAISTKSTGPSTFYIALRGFANGETIAANSITVAGVSTIHNSVTITSNGDFGTTLVGTDIPLSITITGNIPVGPAPIAITGSITGTVTFNWGPNRNILPPNPNPTQVPDQSPFPMGILLSSSTEPAPGPGLLDTDKPSYNVGDRLATFAVGFGSVPVTNVIYTEAPGGSGNTRSMANFDPSERMASS